MAELIVALDVDAVAQAEALIDRLAPLGVIFKVGHEALFGYAQRIFTHLEARGARYFVDAKLHDIPRTAQAAITALVRPGVHLISVHALGGREMMGAAATAARARADALGIPPPRVIAVGILSSHDAIELAELGLRDGTAENVFRLAELARDAGCDGMQGSAQEARALKSRFGDDFVLVTGGIRPPQSDHADQKRVMTPAGAVEAGSDYLVVGRPIIAAPDPVAAARAILDDMNRKVVLR